MVRLRKDNNFTFYFACSIVFICMIFNVISKNWTIFYKDEFNTFFGKGNWEVIDKDKKISTIIKKYDEDGWRIPVKYREWTIKFTDTDGDDVTYRISNHGYLISDFKDKSFFKTNHLSKKQALALEFMDISLDLLSSNLHDELLSDILSEEEAKCISVNLTYKGGNPNRDYYSNLSKQNWFNINDITAKHYLSDVSVNFYIDIDLYDYYFEQLTEEERENIINSIDTIKDKLLNMYGDIASFEINFIKGNSIVYDNGQKID